MAFEELIILENNFNDMGAVLYLSYKYFFQMTNPATQ